MKINQINSVKSCEAYIRKHPTYLQALKATIRKYNAKDGHLRWYGNCGFCVLKNLEIFSICDDCPVELLCKYQNVELLEELKSPELLKKIKKLDKERKGKNEK